MYKVLFVCTGNICRSPTAEGVFRDKLLAAGLAGSINADSAGTHSYHVGHPPDNRTVQTAKQAGYDLSNIRARKFDFADFYEFDLIFAMDKSHLHYLQEQRPDNAKAEVALFLEYAALEGVKEVEVKDPYYGQIGGFKRVLELIELASDAVIGKLSR